MDRFQERRPTKSGKKKATLAKYGVNSTRTVRIRLEAISSKRTWHRVSNKSVKH